MQQSKRKVKRPRHNPEEGAQEKVIVDQFLLGPMRI